MKIVMIGSGNVATALAKRIIKAGHKVVQVKGHTIERVNEIETDGDIYLLAISDNALYNLPGQLNLGDKLIAHTAGSVSKEVLKNISSNYGVLYPLQSLRKELDVLTEIPLLIDANNKSSQEILLQFAKQLSTQVGEADDQQRMKLHIAAVFVNNFTNHLYALAEDYCKKENLDFSLLYPLINETAQRVQLLPAAQLQTGPAIRNDDSTLDKHLALLEKHPSLQALYRQFTKSIREKR